MKSRSRARWQKTEVLLLAAPLFVLVLVLGIRRVVQILWPPPPIVLHEPVARWGTSVLALSPDASLLAAAGAGDGAVQVFDVQGKSLLRTLGGNGGNIRAVTFSPDGKLLAGSNCGEGIEYTYFRGSQIFFGTLAMVP